MIHESGLIRTSRMAEHDSGRVQRTDCGRVFRDQVTSLTEVSTLNRIAAGLLVMRA